jgi:hypothetical protein
MTNEEFLKTLEEHFTVLNKVVQNRLAEAVLPHQETREDYSARLKELPSDTSSDQDSKETIQKVQEFHKANLERYHSLYKEIADETPLTAMLPDLKREHEQILEHIPAKLANPDTPRHYARGKHLYRKLLAAYLHGVAGLVLETRKEITRSMSVLLEDGYNPLPEIHWKEQYKILLGAFFQEHREELAQILKPSGKFRFLEKPKARFKRNKLSRALSELEQLEKSWRVTLFALFEDLRFREQLFIFMQELKLLKIEVSSILSGRIQSTLLPELDKQKAFTSRLLEELQDPEEVSMEELKSYLVKELYRLTKEKKQQEQEGQALGAAEGIPEVLQKLEAVILEELEAFPPKVGIVNAPDYQKGIKPSEISYFSPSEFLEFSSLTAFLQVHKQLKSELAKVIEKLVREFKEFDQIIDFYLDSAIALTQKPGIKEEEVVAVFREGMRRLEDLTEGSRAILHDLEQVKWSEISSNTDTFIDSVRKLDDNDKIINIYTHLLRSKALASSAQNRQRLVSGVKNTSARISKFAARHSQWLRASYEDIRKRLKLTSSSAVITSEISNYLAGIRKRMTQLPVIYQHLFEPAPVKETNLFLSREADTERLDQALADWEKGNFAATLVTGENGSGCSSLMQHYARTLKSPYPVLSFQVERFYSSSQDYYALIGEIFSQEDIVDEDSLEQFVSGLSEKIVMIDGLERIFMRKVNGFDCLRRFLSLVVNTDDQVFWICSVSKIAYHYLSRTVALSEHFDYILDIDHLKGSDIREIILKRNRLSGYKLHFQNSVEESKEGSEENQQVLEEAFFTELERFAGSNIRLSLIYWLQSVESVGEEGIIVGRFSVPDFEFLGSLEARKAFVLLLVVMHGKITEDYHTLVSNCSAEESKGLLSLLKEDSILDKKEEYYFLNGILYRHVIKLLKDRNLIH